jgi:hypothetical protein
MFLTLEIPLKTGFTVLILSSDPHLDTGVSEPKGKGDMSTPKVLYVVHPPSQK